MGNTTLITTPVLHSLTPKMKTNYKITATGVPNSLETTITSTNPVPSSLRRANSCSNGSPGPNSPRASHSALSSPRPNRNLASFDISKRTTKVNNTINNNEAISANIPTPTPKPKPTPTLSTSNGKLIKKRRDEDIHSKTASQGINGLTVTEEELRHKIARGSENSTNIAQIVESKPTESKTTETTPLLKALTTSQISAAQQQRKRLASYYFDCEMMDLITLISSMITELLTLNDALPFDANHLTRFHSRAPPQISVRDYLIRIVKFCSIEKSVLISIIFYIDLLCTRYPTFSINSLTVHRFLITTVMIGTKGLCDSFCTNNYYAKVGGLTIAELNILEVEYLVRVDYRIVPKVEMLQKYYERMVQRMNYCYYIEP